MQLDYTIQKAQVSRTETEVAQAEVYLEKLHNGARASLVESEANYKRAIELRASKTISKTDRDIMLA